MLLLLAVSFGCLTGCTWLKPQEPAVDAVETPKPQPPEEIPQPPEPSQVSHDIPYLILVNAQNPFPANLEPRLKKVQGNFKLEVKAAEALIEMMADAKKEGIDLLVVSAYRPRAKQEQLYNNKVQEFVQQGFSQDKAAVQAAAIVAPPGTSEHNTGLAADIVTPTYQRLNKGFAETAAAKWMAANAHKYGFILRYPEGKQDITGIIFEPWHFRYVGVEDAAKIKEAGLCLEEYLGK